ncbi:MAG: energy-coupling factor transporter transmembrane protein EcfT [Phycisphaerales bacterium]|nr:energy-coupling factor transporter transmembrane protein EcfT [Phycisphaerales bacterium]
MRAEYLDRYSRLSSPVHRLWTGVKLLAAVAVVVVVVSMPRNFWGGWAGLAAVAGFLVVVAAMSGIPWGFLLRRMLWLEPLAIGVALLSLLQVGGWQVFLWLMARSSLCLLTMLLLSNTAPYSELLRVMRRVKVPTMLVTTLALMYRYLFVMMDEAGRIKRARMSRTFSERGGGKSRRWRTAATVVSQLFIRVSERSERIFAAMCARGWGDGLSRDRKGATRSSALLSHGRSLTVAAQIVKDNSSGNEGR